jgi:hypothetical protein
MATNSLRVATVVGAKTLNSPLSSTVLLDFGLSSTVSSTDGMSSTEAQECLSAWQRIKKHR